VNLLVRQQPFLLQDLEPFASPEQFKKESHHMITFAIEYLHTLYIG